MKAIIKPKAKIRKILDWSECTDFIEAKYKIKTRDHANKFGQFAEWVESTGEPKTHCRAGCSKAELEAHQAQYRRYRSAIAFGEIAERPYHDFWHWLIDVNDVQRGGTMELHAEMGERAEPWQKEILALYLKEFGSGPYLTDW